MRRPWQMQNKFHLYARLFYISDDHPTKKKENPTQGAAIFRKNLQKFTLGVK